MFESLPPAIDAVAAPPGAMRMTTTMPQRYGDVQHWRTVASRAMLAGDAELALRCWRHVRQLQPEALDALFHIACCYARLNEPGRACLIFHALATAPTVPEDLRQRAARLAALVDPELA